MPLGRSGRGPAAVETTFGRRVVGIAAIVAAVLIVVLATVRPNPFKDTRTVLARFDSVQGLGRIDRNVRVGGSNAGEVGDVSRDGDDVVVELEIGSDIAIHRDAQAELRPHTLFEGSAFVDLEPGSPSAPLLEEGEVIPKSHTRVYVSVDEALRLFRKTNREALQDLVGYAARILRGEGVRSLRSILARAPALVRELGPTARALRGPEGDELAGAIAGLADTVNGLATREGDLIPLARRANRTLAALDVDGGAALDAAVAALPGPLEQLEADGGRLASLIDRVDRLSVDLVPAVRELAPLLRDSRPLLRRATPLLRRATPLVASLRVILARAAAAAPPLHRSVLAVRPGARLLDESVLPAITAESKLGIPAYAQLVAAFTGGDAVGRLYQTPAQNRNGSGHIVRAGAFIDFPAFLGGLVVPSCAVIAPLSPQVASLLGALGLCQEAP